MEKCTFIRTELLFRKNQIVPLLLRGRHKIPNKVAERSVLGLHRKLGSSTKVRRFSFHSMSVPGIRRCQDASYFPEMTSDARQ